ncbi:MAG: hypothetical protein MI864_03620, partial [Pseudomonadales bacterium]|nr:hypothetical protein [Pseudomonadales bacterium]
LLAIQTGLIQRVPALLEGSSTQSPWRPYMQYNAAIALAKNGSVQEAIALLSKIDFPSISTPEPSRTHFGRGQEVASLSTKIVYLVPEFTDAEQSALRDKVLIAISRLYLRQGAIDQALQHLQAIRMDSVQGAEALVLYSLAAAKDGQLNVARKALQRVLSSDDAGISDVLDARFTLGRLFEIEGRPQDALQSYAEATEFYKTHLANLESSPEALQQILRSWVRLQPGYSERYVPMPLPSQTGGSSRDSIFSDLFTQRSFSYWFEQYVQVKSLSLRLAQWDQSLTVYRDTLSLRERSWKSRQIEARKILDQPEQQAKLVALKAKHQLIEQQILRGENTEDGFVFASSSQRLMQQHIESANEKLKQLMAHNFDPDLIRQGRLTLSRAQSALYWQVQNQYAVTRWNARALHGSTAELLDEAEVRQKRIRESSRSDVFLGALEDQLSSLTSRFYRLEEKQQAVLQGVEQQLVKLMQAEIRRLQDVAQQHLLMTGLARTRLLDALQYEGAAAP